jgi:hypothetical protein
MMYLFRCKFLFISLNLLHCLHDIIRTWSRSLFFLIFVYYLIYVSLLVRILDLKFTFLWPLQLVCVFSWSRDWFIHVCLIVKEIPSLCYMFISLLALFDLEELSLLNLFNRVKVFFLEIVSLYTSVAFVCD